MRDFRLTNPETSHSFWQSHYKAVRELESILDAMGVPHHKLRPHPELEPKQEDDNE